MIILTAPVSSFGQLPPKLQRPIIQGQRIIVATVHEAGEWTVRVLAGSAEVANRKQTIAAADKGELTFDFIEMEVPDNASAQLTELKKNGLKKDWAVKLFKGTATDPEDTVMVREASAHIYLTRPREGDQIVKGSIDGQASRVRVQVLDPTGALVESNTAAISDGDARQPGKKFDAGLNRPLSAGHTVKVLAYEGDAEVAGSSDFALVESSVFDWGRVRGYFTLGTTVGQREATETDSSGALSRKRSFDRADYFVSFNADYTWYSSLTDKTAIPCARPARAVEDLRQLEHLANQWDGSSFDSRLKAIKDPVIQLDRLKQLMSQFYSVLKAAGEDLARENGRQDCLAIETARIELLKSFAERLRPDDAEFERLRKPADTANKSIAGAQRDRAIATSQEPIKAKIDEIRSIIDQLAVELKSFRTSDPNLVKGGFLLNSAFEARIGQTVVTESASSSTTSQTTQLLQRPSSGSVQLDIYAPWWQDFTSWRFDSRENAIFLAPLTRFHLLSVSQGPVQVVNENNVLVEKPELFRHLYASQAYGIRFGHFLLDPRRKSVSPELLSYLDITIGRFGNFRSLDKPDAGPGTNDRIPWRIESTGRFKIPATPLYVGFMSNHGVGKDDMRYFFGTRFDISKLLGRLIPANP
jgi:hypothetical protein